MPKLAHDVLLKRLDALSDLERFDMLIGEAIAALASEESEALYERLILALINARRPIEAIGYAKKALVLYPGSSDLHYLLALAYNALSQYKKALFHAKTSNANNPFNARCYALEAQLQAQLGRKKEAQKALKNALELDPLDAEVRLYHASALYFLDEDKKALAVLDDLLAQEPRNADAIAFKSQISHSRPADRLATLRTLLRLNPAEKTWQHALVQIGRYYMAAFGLMAVVLIAALANHFFATHLPAWTEKALLLLFYVTAIFSARDWRINIPFMVAFLLLILPEDDAAGLVGLILLTGIFQLVGLALHYLAIAAWLRAAKLYRAIRLRVDDHLQ